jgi:hypothetical protein
MLLLAPAAPAAEVTVPLPRAPVRAVIPDVTAFDAALTGSYRRALRGDPSPDESLTRSWRRTAVGSKLERQWSLFSAHLPWAWDEILKLEPRSAGLALLSAGSLEAVMALDTPLAAIPLSPPAGEAKTHGAVTYHLVAQGAGDASPDPERRMGLAWARSGGWLFLASSERALLLALDAAQDGRGVPALPAGLLAVELDVDALRADRYFRREFLFEDGAAEGRVVAALRLEEGRLVEVREGRGGANRPAATFDAPGAAWGWEPDGAGLWPALRSALLDPVPSPPVKPVPAMAALPPAARPAAADRYLVDFEKPPPAAGRQAWEEGDLALWRDLWAKYQPAGWGYAIAPDRARRIVFEWPAALDRDLERVCLATVARRGGPAVAVSVGDARELRVGPALPALALKRRGDFIWMAARAADLEDAPTPRRSPDLLRWGRSDLAAIRTEAARWERAEGPPAPERIRPFSDRILGVLGWMPSTTSISVERRRAPDGGGWTERVVFGTDED